MTEQELGTVAPAATPVAAGADVADTEPVDSGVVTAVDGSGPPPDHWSLLDRPRATNVGEVMDAYLERRQGHAAAMRNWLDGTGPNPLAGHPMRNRVELSPLDHEVKR